MGGVHLFSIKNIFYDKMDLRLFYFDVKKYPENVSWISLSLFYGIYNLVRKTVYQTSVSSLVLNSSFSTADLIFPR